MAYVNHEIETEHEKLSCTHEKLSCTHEKLSCTYWGGSAPGYPVGSTVALRTLRRGGIESEGFRAATRGR
jgi:hypothetical protein